MHKKERVQIPITTEKTEQAETLNKESEVEVLESLLEKAKGETKRIDPHDKNFHKQVLKFA